MVLAGWIILAPTCTKLCKPTAQAPPWRVREATLLQTRTSNQASTSRHKLARARHKASAAARAE